MTAAQIPIIVICGPTACGKTALALKLAEIYPIEIVSADSRQVYQYMDIGTAKVTPEEQAIVKHHLVDVVTPDRDFSVATFTELAHRAIREIVQRNRIPVIVGGTGLYIRALTDGLIDAPAENVILRAELLTQEEKQPGILYERLLVLDAKLAQSLHRHDITRIVRGLEVHAATGVCLSQMQIEHGFNEKPYRALKLAINVERQTLYARIDQRVEMMMAAGLVREVQQLLERGYSPELKAMRTIGYRQVIAHLCAGLALDEAVAWMQRDSRRYAKRQLTWFRKDKAINWVEYPEDFASIKQYIDEFNFNLMMSKGVDSHGKNTV